MSTDKTLQSDSNTMITPVGVTIARNEAKRKEKKKSKRHGLSKKKRSGGEADTATNMRSGGFHSTIITSDKKKKKNNSSFQALIEGVTLYALCLLLPSIVGYFYSSDPSQAGGPSYIADVWADVTDCICRYTDGIPVFSTLCDEKFDREAWLHSLLYWPSRLLALVPQQKILHHDSMNQLDGNGTSFDEKNVLTIASDQQISDAGIILIVTISLAILRLLMVHLFVPKYLAPKRMEALVRCKSIHLLSSEYQLTLTPKLASTTKKKVLSINTNASEATNTTEPTSKTSESFLPLGVPGIPNLADDSNNNIHTPKPIQDDAYLGDDSQSSAFVLGLCIDDDDDDFQPSPFSPKPLDDITDTKDVVKQQTKLPDNVKHNLFSIGHDNKAQNELEQDQLIGKPKESAEADEEEKEVKGDTTDDDDYVSDVQEEDDDLSNEQEDEDDNEEKYLLPDDELLDEELLAATAAQFDNINDNANNIDDDDNDKREPNIVSDKQLQCPSTPETQKPVAILLTESNKKNDNARKLSFVSLRSAGTNSGSTGASSMFAPKYATAVFRLFYCTISCTMALLLFRDAYFWPWYVFGNGSTVHCWDLSGGVSLAGKVFDIDFDHRNTVLRYYFLVQVSYHLHSTAFQILTVVLFWLSTSSSSTTKDNISIASTLSNSSTQQFKNQHRQKGRLNSKLLLTAYLRSLLHHTLSLLWIVGAYIFSSLRRLGAIGMFAYDASSWFLHLLQLCMNSPSSEKNYRNNDNNDNDDDNFLFSKPTVVKYLHMYVVIPSFVYFRFIVWSFIGLSTMSQESKYWLTQLESTLLIPGSAKYMRGLFQLWMLLWMGFNMIHFKRLVFHPHLISILKQEQREKKQQKQHQHHR